MKLLPYLKLITVFTLFLSSIVTIESCYIKCDEPMTMRNSELFITVVDETNNYLYTENNSVLDLENFIVHDEFGDLLHIRTLAGDIPGSIDSYYELVAGSLYSPKDGEIPFENQLCKKFYLDYGDGTYDTLSTCYKARKTECGEVFDNIKVYHEGELLADISGDVFIPITVVKK